MTHQENQHRQLRDDFANLHSQLIAMEMELLKMPVDGAAAYLEPVKDMIYDNLQYLYEQRWDRINAAGEVLKQLAIQ